MILTRMVIACDHVYCAYLYYKLGDRAKGVEEDVASSVEIVTRTVAMSTEMDVIETTNDDDPRNDTSEQQAEGYSSSSVEAKEEASDEDAPLQTVDTVTQADEADENMETSPMAYNLLDISSTPVMVAHATVDFIGQNNNNFLKGCKWYS